MAYFLAIDAGGTKTDYLLADETRELARVRTGTIKRLRTDGETAKANLASAMRSLEMQSCVPMLQVTRTCVGTAGQTVPLVTDFLRSELGARVGGSLLILGDVEIALDAAFPGESGVLVLAGTGSNVAGRTADGHVRTVGGWGPALSDQGSGYRIGHMALRAVGQAHDEGLETTLLEAMLTFWNLASFDLLVEHANRTPAPDISQLVELVVRCAASGDALSREILISQGEELAGLVRLLIRQLRAASGETAFVPRLAFAGSILEKVQPVREALLRAVWMEFPETAALAGVVDPVLGALWRARTGNGFAD